VVNRLVGRVSASITLGIHSLAIPAMEEEVAALIAGLVFGSE
jgi:hypothetical protein